jgi:hypothetical protein
VFIDCEREQKYTDTTYIHNSTTAGVVVKNKKIWAPQTYHLRIQQEQECTCLTEITFVIAMDDNDDWLANNRTWKKWTGLGEGGSLSYAGIDFHKPKDEERLLNEAKRRKKLKGKN